MDSIKKRVIVLVENEVALSLPIHISEQNIEGNAMIEAIFASEPTVMVTDEEVFQGYSWDGTNFNPPA
jgi:hypothetical protein